jgi:hypothetical protein
VAWRSKEKALTMGHSFRIVTSAGIRGPLSDGSWDGSLYVTVLACVLVIASHLWKTVNTRRYAGTKALAD